MRDTSTQIAGMVPAYAVTFVLLFAFFSILFSAHTNTRSDLTAENKNSIASLYEDAERFFATGEYASSIYAYEEILKRDPTQHGIYAELAHVYRYWGDYEMSEKMFLEAIARDAQNHILYTELGKLYRNMSRYEEAHALFDKSLMLSPTDDRTYSYGLGYLYLDEEKYDAAENAFQKALELNPESDFAYMGLGDLYRKTGTYEDAETNFRKSLEMNSRSEAYNGLGWLYFEHGKFVEAEAAFIAFLDQTREKGEIYYGLGLAQQHQGRTGDARISLRRATELNPNNQTFKDALAALEHESR